jgi:hypothetical protein
VSTIVSRPHPQRIEWDRQFDHFLQEGAAHRRDGAKLNQNHQSDAVANAGDHALQRDTAHPFADPDCLHDIGHVIAQQNDVGRLGADAVAAASAGASLIP